MPTAELIDQYPLYRKYQIKLPAQAFQLPKPPIHMFCPQPCKSEQTFQMTNEYYGTLEAPGTPVSGLISKVIYTCAACGKFQRIFMLYFSPGCDFVMKVGQYPPWSIDVDKKVSRMLGDHVEYFRRGLVCKSQGYGLGAVAYYRRIVEKVIDVLLDQITQLIPPEDQDKYKKALDETKKTIVTQDKIELVKDMLPAILRPSGMNPLGILYQALSEGLHDKDEDECLVIADSIKGSLVFLVNQVLAAQEQGRTFTDGMKKLLDKKSKKAD
jgi:hypothetical protein